MKANFKIEKPKTETNLESQNSEELTEAEFEEFLETLPPGWNLWSVRTTKKAN